MIHLQGYEANNLKELHELVECDVISSDKYQELVEELEMGNIGVKKERIKYKEQCEELRQTLGMVRSQNYKMSELINELYDIGNEAVKNKIDNYIKYL